MAVALLGGAIIAGAAGPGSADSPSVKLAATFVQDGALVAVAVAFAALVGRPRLSQFGLRPTALKLGVIATVLAAIGFFSFSAACTELIGPLQERNTLTELGIARGTGSLVAAAVLVLVVAPIAEEFFFRGFFYRALRSRFSLAAATSIIAVLYGALHYDGAATLPLLPVLAVLGATFCLLYELTGSLFPAIALHAANNTIAFAATADAPAAVPVAVATGALTIGACIAAPVFQAARTHPRPPTAPQTAPG